MRITFKKQPRETGLMGVGHPYPHVDIKADGKIIGLITPGSWQNKFWTIGYTVEGGDNPNCCWRWLFVGYDFVSEDAARQWAKENTEAWLASLHCTPYAVDKGAED